MLVLSGVATTPACTGVSQYVTAWNNALASAKQRFLDSLTQEQRDAIANLNNKIAQADALVTSIGAAVTAALSAALNVVNTAESAISNAVSASITAFMKFLQGFLTHVWDLNMTQLQADLNNLTSTIALEVAKVANAVLTAANPKKTEAETQLSSLTGISGPACPTPSAAEPGCKQIDCHPAERASPSCNPGLSCCPRSSLSH